MMTAKATVVLVLAYVLALAAGTTSGVLAERLRSPGLPAGAAPLAAQLQLSAPQCAQMRQTWQAAEASVDDCLKDAQIVERRRDQALVDLLTDEQKLKFAAMDKEFAHEFAAIGDRRKAAFQDALGKTEDMLTSEQRSKYEQIVRDRLGHSPKTEATTEPSFDAMGP